MKIGQKVTRYPVSFSEPDGKKGQKPMTGTVVYIHPLGRFHIVEFELRGGKVQERASREQKTDEEDGHDVSI